MIDLQSEILKNLCIGLGEGNSNTNKITDQIIESHPDLEYLDTKSKVIDSLVELRDSGQIQITTTGWEIGQEFLYICSKRLED